MTADEPGEKKLLRSRRSQLRSFYLCPSLFEWWNKDLLKKTKNTLVPDERWRWDERKMCTVSPHRLLRYRNKSTAKEKGMPKNNSWRSANLFSLRPCFWYVAATKCTLQAQWTLSQRSISYCQSDSERTDREARRLGYRERRKSTTYPHGHFLSVPEIRKRSALSDTNEEEEHFSGSSYALFASQVFSARSKAERKRQRGLRAKPRREILLYIYFWLCLRHLQEKRKKKGRLCMCVVFVIHVPARK